MLSDYLHKLSQSASFSFCACYGSTFGKTYYKKFYRYSYCQKRTTKLTFLHRNVLLMKKNLHWKLKINFPFQSLSFVDKKQSQPTDETVIIAETLVQITLRSVLDHTSKRLAVYFGRSSEEQYCFTDLNCIANGLRWWCR